MKRAMSAINSVLCAIVICVCSTMPVSTEEAKTHAAYVGYTHGLKILSVDTVSAIYPTAYHIEVSYHLAGVAGLIMYGDGNTVVDGRFVADHAEPRQLSSIGNSRGEPHLVQIDWNDGSPKVMRLIPPLEEDREPVIARDQAHTIDVLSGIALLVREMNYAGNCDGSTKTFDGRRLASISSRTVGKEMLDETDRSSYNGPALRCDFQWQQLGGFFEDDDQEELRKPLRGSAWFARLEPGQLLVPVRIMLEARLLGETTLYLTRDL